MNATEIAFVKRKLLYLDSALNVEQKLTKTKIGMKTKIGDLVGGNLKTNTMHIEVSGEINLVAGKFAVVPIEDYKKLLIGSQQRLDPSEKVRIHICIGGADYNEGLYVDASIPYVPVKGEVLYLSDKILEELKQQIIDYPNRAKDYAPEWFFGSSYDCTDPKKENLKDLSFADAIFVDHVWYDANENRVSIVIGK